MSALTPIEALIYALSRNVVLPDEYYAGSALSRQLTASITGLSQLDQIKYVMDTLNKSLATGGTFNEFQKAVKEGASINLPRHHLDNIYRTNMQGAYNTGRYTQIQRSNATKYILYSSINDGRTRPSHRLLDGTIRAKDDAFWLSHTPPLGYRCRCGIIGLSASQAEARGITLDDELKNVEPDSGFSGNPIAVDQKLVDLLKERITQTEISSTANASAQLSDLQRHTVEDSAASKALISYLPPFTPIQRDLFNQAIPKALGVGLSDSLGLRLSQVYVDNMAKALNEALTSPLAMKQVGGKVSNALADLAQKVPSGAVNMPLQVSDMLMLNEGTVFSLATPAIAHAVEDGSVILKVLSGAADLSVLGLSDLAIIPSLIAFEVVRYEVVNNQTIITVQLTDKPAHTQINLSI